MRIDGTWLKLQRLKYGMKGIDLAKKMGVDQSYISKMENDRVPVTAQVVNYFNSLASRSGTSDPDLPVYISGTHKP